MPRDIDREQRLKDIADATIRVARTKGSQAVTIRSVAHELGGSTTLVTNYLPSRAELILNVLDRANARWSSDYMSAVVGLTPFERFIELVSWDPRPDESEAVFRALILEIVANADAEPLLRAALQRESNVYRNELLEAAREADFVDPELAANLGYLLLRGVYFANGEDPEYWDPSRMRHVAIATIQALPRNKQLTASLH